VKLVLDQAEPAAFRRWRAEQGSESVACDLVRTEVMRVARRGDPDALERARAVLSTLTLTHVTAAACDRAGLLEPRGVCSLGAIHLAAALELGSDIEGLVTHDDRLGEAAWRNGLVVVRPEQSGEAQAQRRH
jgi:predicted nucleic acid-binding protein